MTKRIVLHCGLGKTGTSALQVQFAQARDAIIDQLGIDYIKTGAFEDQLQGRISSGNGVKLAQSFLPERHPSSLYHRRDEVTAEVIAQVRESRHDVLLSSEFFSAIPYPELREMLDYLKPEGEIELVYFVRNQVSLMASAYMQKVKRHGETGLPGEFFKTWVKQHNQNYYFRRFKKLREIVPDMPIHIRMYEDSIDHPQGIFGLFLSTIGLNPEIELGLDDLPVNTSPSPLELRLMLEINRFKPRMQFSDMLVEASAQAGRSRFHAQASILPPDIRQKIKDTYDADNKAFFKEFFGCENRYEIEADVDYVDLETLLFEPNDVLSIIGGLLSKMDRRIASLEAAMLSGKR